jgi:hypothetical protein
MDAKILQRATRFRCKLMLHIIHKLHTPMLSHLEQYFVKSLTSVLLIRTFGVMQFQRHF